MFTSIRGVKGDKGQTGNTGVKGDTGDTGVAGAKGDKGDTGDTGAAGSAAWTDRGDSVAYDFATADLTKDAAWHDLDLSGIIPENTKLVLLRIVTFTAGANSPLKFRTNGYSNLINIFHTYTKAANITSYHAILIAPDANRKVEYNAQAITWTALNILVAGWFL